MSEAATGTGDDERARVTKLNGAPGAGKTAQLTEYAEEERNRGLPLADLYYLTFTRAGRRESEGRLKEVYPECDPDDAEDHAKTVHGAAWRACWEADVIEDPKQVIQPGSGGGDGDGVLSPYEAFCKREGMTFSPGSKDPLKLARDGDSADKSGNRFYAVYNWLKLTRKPYEKFAQAPVDLPMGRSAALRLFEAWDDFKQNVWERPLLEHTDYVDEAIDRGLVPPVSVLFIDEFQDLSPQEYLLIKTWRGSGEIDRMYLAGDVNQSVYSFRAARPVYFAETEADNEEMRVESYRCPVAIVSVARGILEACDGTDPNGFRAKRRGGTVNRPRLETGDELAGSVRYALATHEPDEDTGNTVFLLTRTNRQVGTLASKLEAEGVRYSMLGSGRDRWGEELCGLYDALASLRDRDTVRVDVLARLTDNIPSGGDVLDRVVGGKALPPRVIANSDVEIPTDDARAALEAEGQPTAPVRLASELDVHYYDRRRLKNALRAGGDAEPGRVKVGTIHAAKGLEAPCVYLFDDYTANLRESYHTGETTAEEHRLYYVGATRASETLNVVAGFSPTGSEVFPPMEGQLPQAAVEEVVAE